ncbi:MAG: polyprenyl diphosphate synthase [Spirochaetes bacterium]|jgi:undecaprenyl diphosphate synthase|nr:polyprenyl diphosphate synthase [Spirochaetota bacterium]
MPSLRDSVDRELLPQHVAVIMDGNGRWAKSRGLSRAEGHRKGAEAIEKLMDAALELSINSVSLYAFSTENWSRPPAEIGALWDLLCAFFDEKLPIMIEKGVRVYHSGSRKKLPARVCRVLDEAVLRTAGNKGLKVNFCLNYGARQEIVTAVNHWAKQAKPGESFSEKKMDEFLYTRDLPDVDLLIRTSGECRISNFLLWQCAYAEFIFLKVMWPDFRSSHLYRAIIEFQKRNRRFGGL